MPDDVENRRLPFVVREQLRHAWERRGWVRDRGPQIAVAIGLLLVTLGTAGFLGVLDSVQEADDLAAVDTPVLEGLAAARSHPLTVVMTVITTITGPVVLPILVLIGALVWGFVGKQRWQAGLLAAAMIVSTLVSSVIKAVVARPRPPVDTMTVAGVETTYSFPSGHTIGTATLLLVVGYLAWIRKPRVGALVGWLSVILAGIFVVALSRLYLGYHFVTDVVASMALAVAVLGGVVVADRRRAVRAARVTAATAKAQIAGDGPTTPTPLARPSGHGEPTG
ncbi:MAG: phosphoesterase PA-phosphatase related protein [Actinotalea sp.]|nr:phosphoesterase PA-phosphatase related protein [Actinotalea sp.]